MKTLVILLSILLLNSCKVTKDTRAVNRVKADINLLNDVGPQWAKLNPCTVDTIREFINGKEVVRYDTLFNERVDTVYKDNTQTVYKTIVKYINKTDTLKVYVIDNRAERVAVDQLNNSQGQVTQLKADNAQLKKESKARLWWLIGVGVIGFLAIVFLVYLLLKKP